MGKVIWDKSGLHHYDDDNQPTNLMQELRVRLLEQLQPEVCICGCVRDYTFVEEDHYPIRSKCQ